MTVRADTAYRHPFHAAVNTTIKTQVSVTHDVSVTVGVAGWPVILTGWPVTGDGGRGQLASIRG